MDEGLTAQKAEHRRLQGAWPRKMTSGHNALSLAKSAPTSLETDTERDPVFTQQIRYLHSNLIGVDSGLRNWSTIGCYKIL